MASKKRRASSTSLKARPFKKQKFGDDATPSNPDPSPPTGTTPMNRIDNTVTIANSPNVASTSRVTEMNKEDVVISDYRNTSMKSATDGANDPLGSTVSADSNASAGSGASSGSKKQNTVGKTEEEARVKKPDAKKPNVKDLFEPWEDTVTIPELNQFWGIKPTTGDPRPHPKQPPARTSDAAVNPELWEDRKFRFKPGSQFVHYFGTFKQTAPSGVPKFDQEHLLSLQLIDMRPVSRNYPTPRRRPTLYQYEHGKPKDWNNKQAIKALNDRRGQAIDRITMDPPWTAGEREFLASSLRDDPNASIWELAERFNDRFKNKDFTESTGLAFSEQSTGRTVESVRYEYMTYKPAYDLGEVPRGIRYRVDKSKEGKAARKDDKMTEVFGPSDKQLEKQWDELAAEDGDDEDSEHDDDGDAKKKSARKEAGSSKKTTSSRKTTAQKSAIAKNQEQEGESHAEAAARMAEQPKLDEDDETLLELAGGYDTGEIRFPSQTVRYPLEIDTAVARHPWFTIDSPISTLSDPPEGLLTPTPEQSPVSGVQSKEILTVDTQATQIVKTVEKTHITAPRAIRNVQIDENYDENDEEL